MTFIQTYLIVSAGIALSFLLPVIRKAVDGVFPSSAGESTLQEIIRKYGLLAIFSLLTAILIIAFTPDTSEVYTDWRAALLLGYAWDSTLQKLSRQ